MRPSRVCEDYVYADPAQSSDEEKKLTVETCDNHIYFYASVDSDRCLALIKEIRYLDKTLRNERETRDLPSDFPHTPIWLHVNSPGGYVTDGFATSDQLKLIKTPIYSIVEGMSASAATLISMACTKRFILPSSYIMLHQLSTFAWGTYEQIKDEVKLLDMMMKRLSAFYESHSKLTRDRIVELLQHDSWFNAEQSVESGLADEILV